MAHESQIEQARKDAYNKSMGAPETAPKSKTKSGKFALGGYIVGMPIIGAIIGHFFPSEDLKRAKRDATAAGADAALKKAEDLGIFGEQYAKLAKDAKKAKVLSKETEKRHSGFYGTILGAIAGTVLAVLSIMTFNPIGLIAAAAVFIGTPLLGTAYDKTRDGIASISANSAGNKAYKEALSKQQTPAPVQAQAKPIAANQEVQPNPAEQRNVKFTASVIARDEAKGGIGK